MSIFFAIHPIGASVKMAQSGNRAVELHARRHSGQVTCPVSIKDGDFEFLAKAKLGQKYGSQT